ncbi:FAD-dependent oxidoreductase [Micromonospora trifolii]|uniref:FAD-dependent oxidoreductase n=1 Tax=Micromonospora trifolii TaxID=2911208 RepID=UPI003CF8B143
MTVTRTVAADSHVRAACGTWVSGLCATYGQLARRPASYREERRIGAGTFGPAEEVSSPKVMVTALHVGRRTTGETWSRRQVWVLGANTALRDAALLCRKLTEVQAGTTAVVPALHDYERQMLSYGFAAVRQSLRNARQARSTSRLTRTTLRATLRTVNAMPPLRRRMTTQLGQ